MGSIITSANDPRYLKHSWSSFSNRDPTKRSKYLGTSSSYRLDRTPRFRGVDRSIVTSILTQLAVDVASVSIRHVYVDEDGRFTEPVESGLDNCLTIEANIDQSGRAFVQDLAMTMFERGCAAVVPVRTDHDPLLTNSYEIQEARIGYVTEWYPRHVTVNVYNDQTGQREEITLPKKIVALVPNPFYAVMNEPNSTLQRLIRKLSLLDATDEQNSGQKFNMIIQLPYVVKSDARKAQAEQRSKDIENQLKTSQYGIAYTDGTEKITQLNRPLENNLMSQIQYLTSMLYSQLGVNQAVFDGTADEATMLNYQNRTIEPCVSAIVDELKRKYLTKTARSRNQTIMSFKEPFKLTPVSDLAQIADTFTRNEILSPNDFRQIMGFKPSSSEDSDELRNRNMPVEDTGAARGEYAPEDQLVDANGNPIDINDIQ